MFCKAMNIDQLLLKGQELSEAGNLPEAERIFDQILAVDSSQLEAMFGKGFCTMKTEPKSSYDLFRKVVLQIPDEPAAWINLGSVAEPSGNLDDACQIISGGIARTTDGSLELILRVLRSDVLKRKKDYVGALVDLYCVMWDVHQAGPNEFCDFKSVWEQIVYLKHQLRSDTIGDPSMFSQSGDELKIIEYEYDLPEPISGQEKYIFEFGKHMGRYVSEVMDDYPDYIVWCMQNLDHVCFSEEIVAVVSDSVPMDEVDVLRNQWKLQLREKQRQYWEDEGHHIDSFSIDNNGRVSYQNTFSRQDLAGLYRKWLYADNKNINNAYDKTQVDDLFELLKSGTEDYVDELINEDWGQIKMEYPEPMSVYRAELPIPFLSNRKMHILQHEFLVIGNNIQCITLPGCVVVGENPRDAFEKIFLAVIECLDARRLNNRDLLNRVFTMKLYHGGDSEMDSQELISLKKEEGWNIEYDGIYHIILFKENDKTSLVIPKNEVVKAFVCHTFYTLKFQMSGKKYFEMYGER